LYDEEIHSFYASLKIVRIIKSRRMKWVGHVAHIGKIIIAYKILVGSAEGNIPLGRSRE
jgi:hypothetical protein